MKRKAKIFYVAMDDFWRKGEKLAWLRENPISKIAFERVNPDEKHNWINQSDNDFDTLIPIISKEVKTGENSEAIFAFYSFGVATNRDEWVYDLSRNDLKERILFLTDEYNNLLKTGNQEFPKTIKWSDSLKSNFNNRKAILFDEKKICKSFYRPFNHRFFYAEKLLNDRLTVNHKWLFGEEYNSENPCIGYIGIDTVIPFSALAFSSINDLNSLSNAAGGVKTMPLYRYENKTEKHDNITDWAVEEFARRGAKGLSKEDIFHYVYAVLHYPPYREKYEQNLKREFPRIPVYKNALEWAKLGKALMDLHINYESAEPYPLVRKDLAPTSAEDFTPKPAPKLKADKENGVIHIDSHTHLEGVPQTAWEYKLGNRSALEWILDQYKERKPKDPTIAERFNTYRFADYKEHVIDLVTRVCTVSVKTMKIIDSMPSGIVE